MDLSKISIDPRLRNPWEAIDLGFVLARAWWKPLVLCWAIPSFILFIICNLLFVKAPEYAYFIVWWLKPLWDRLPIILASRALFGEALNVKPVLRETLKIFKSDWFAAITWRRFSPTRSFDIPLTILEGLRGANRSRRMAILHRTSASPAIALTLVGVFIEIILIVGIWGAAVFLIPAEIEVDWFSVLSSEKPLQIYLSNTISFVCMALIAPFYTMGGFALYICRRIELEGWDIEIRFRHLATKLKSASKKNTVSNSSLTSPKNSPTPKHANRVPNFLLPVLLAVFSFTVVSENTIAQEQLHDDQQVPVEFVEPEFLKEYYQSIEEFPQALLAKQSIVEVMSGEDFFSRKTVEGWRWKEAEANDEETSIVATKVADFFDWLGDLFAPIRYFIVVILGGFEVLLWIVLIATFVFVLYRYRAVISTFVGEKKYTEEVDETPEILFGLDIRKESLPDDVPAQVLALWQEKNHREAVGLLYRASLSGLINHYAFKFFDGYTEQECVEIVKEGENQSLYHYVEHLTQVWQLTAYAHRMPTKDQVVELCTQWPDHFAEVRPNAK